MKNDILRQYLYLYNELINAKNEIAEAKKSLSDLCRKLDDSLTINQAAYKQKIDAIDRQISEVNIYLSEAKRYVNPVNYIPKPIESHTARLQQLFTMLGRDSAGLQAADELFRRCKDLILFYETKQNQHHQSFESQNAQVQRNKFAGPETSAISQKRSNAAQRITALISGPEMKQLAAAITEIDKTQFVQAGISYELDLPQSPAPQICVGNVMVPFPADGEDVAQLSHVLGRHYSSEHNSILLPVCFSSNDFREGIHTAARLSVSANSQTAPQISGIIRMILFNILRSYIPMCKRVYLLDFDSFNTEHLGCMKAFVGDENLIVFPQNEKAVAKELTALEAAINTESGNIRPRRFLIIRGTPTGDGASKLKLLLHNSLAYNLSVIQIERDHGLSAFFQTLDSVSHIFSENNAFYFEVDGKKVQFDWFSPPKAITEQTIKTFCAAYKPKTVSNEYESFAPFPQMPDYVHARKPITVPYGMTAEKKLVELSFEGMNFASFFMGASGSGKSTLLHSIIAGILQKYHPDEVELWLVDLKLMEFANYVHHMPPHIKFILMDSAPELIFDFIDRLYEEMSRRETLIAACRCSDRKDVPVSVYLPTAFVIIDEFSVLSDVVKNNEVFKDKLQQLLVKGRAAGLRFIFSSQKFTGGTAALSATAHDQIGLRIAMKHPLISEIKDTLSIPSGQYTDDMLNAVETLAPYYTLRRLQHRNGSHSLEKAMGLYFKGKGEDAWASRYAFIDRLNQNMKAVPVEQYDCQNAMSYVDKHPIIVSGSDLSVFSSAHFKKEVSFLKMNPPDDYDEDNLLVSMGVPRKLQNDLFAALTPDWKENILLYAGNEERPCAASVILSVIRSFYAQGLRVQLWAHPKNLIYKKYRDTAFQSIDLYVGSDQVGEAIKAEVERIRSGSSEQKLIIVLGAERFASDFEMSDNIGFFAGRNAATVPDVASVMATTLEEQQLAALADEDEIALAELADKFYEAPENIGKSDEQLDAEFEIISAKYYEEKYKGTWTIRSAEPEPQTKVAESPKITGSELIRYFQALISEGSAYGTHFLVSINNLQALSRAGIKADMFNHRITFRTDSPETSMSIINNSSAFRLSNHIFRYTVFGSGSGSYALKPFLHPEVCWDGWSVNEKGQAISPNHIL